jgi:hypothetical protein
MGHVGVNICIRAGSGSVSTNTRENQLVAKDSWVQHKGRCTWDGWHKYLMSLSR